MMQHAFHKFCVVGNRILIIYSIQIKHASFLLFEQNHNISKILTPEYDTHEVDFFLYQSERLSLHHCSKWPTEQEQNNPHPTLMTRPMKLF